MKRQKKKTFCTFRSLWNLMNLKGLIQHLECSPTLSHLLIQTLQSDRPVIESKRLKSIWIHPKIVCFTLFSIPSIFDCHFCFFVQFLSSSTVIFAFLSNFFLRRSLTNSFFTAASNRQRSERSLSGNNKNFRSGGKRSSTITQEVPQKRKKRPGYED